MTSGEVHLPPYPHQLEIACRIEAEEVRLIVRGELDLASAPDLKRELRNADDGDGRRIVVDLAGLEFIDSTGIHVLIEAHQRAETNGHKLVLTHVPAHAQRLFGLTGINTLLSIE